jgi:DNA-binding CsgD family transcriptional regulator
VGVPLRPGARQTPLVERADELAVLQDAISRVRDGQGGVVVVRGPAGIGKSRLLETVSTATGLQVFQARANELERDYTFGLVHRLFDGLIHGLSATDRAGLFTGAAAHCAPLFDAGDAGSANSGFATLRGLWWLLLGLSAHGPVALVCDDVQWADSASLRWLAFIASRLGETAVLLVVAERTDEPGAPSVVASLGGLPATLVEPAALSAGATAAVLQEWLGATVEPDFAASAQLACRGNPFLVTELARDLLANGVAPVDREAPTISRVAPHVVTRRVLDRLAVAPPAATVVARTLAVLGDDARTVDAATVAGITEAETRDAAAWLMDAGILQRRSGLSFEHPLVRDAVYQSIAPTVRSGMHAHAADILGARGASPEYAAAHLLHAEAAGSQRSVLVLREAAALARARGATELAARYLARALEEPPTTGRAEIVAELAHAELLSGSPRAIEHLEEAIASVSEPARRSRLVGQLASATLAMGDPQGALRLIEEQAPHEATYAELSRAELDGVLDMQAALAGAAFMSGAAAWATTSPRLEAVPLDLLRSTPAGKPLLALLAVAEFRRGGSATRAYHLAAEALADEVLLRRTSDILPFLLACYAANRTYGVPRALELLDVAIESATSRGDITAFAATSCQRGLSRALLGDLRGATADLEGATEAARDHGLALLEWQCLASLLVAYAEQGDCASANAELQRAGLTGEIPANSSTAGTLEGRARVRLAEGRWQDAYDDFMECGRREAPYTDVSQMVWWRSSAAVAAYHLGRPDEAHELARRQLAANQAWGHAPSIGHAERALGVIVGGDEGIDLLASSVEHLEAGQPNELCHALLALGRALRQARHRADARPVLQRCVALAERIGCDAILREAAVDLAAVGGRPRNVVRVGVDALTPSERRVADLAASGLSNPEIAQRLFISRKTVEKHLASCFGKLQIASRTALADQLSSTAAPEH